MQYSPIKKRTNIYKPNRFKVISRKANPIVSIIIKIILTVGFIGGIYYLIFRSGFLTVKKVEVSGDIQFTKISDVKVLAESNILGRNILFLNESSITSMIKTNFLVVKQIDFKKRFPGFVSIYIKDRIPLALVHGKTDDNYYMIDDEGFIIGVVDKNFSLLPMVNYSGDVLIGHFIDRTVVPVYLEIIDNLKRENLSVSSMSINDKYSNMFLNNGPEVLLANNKDKASAFRIITTLINKFKDGEKILRKIDLRYGKVIVS